MECSRCHFLNPDGFRYCGSCGTLLLAPADGDDLRADWRHLTVMFCDLVGSTPLSEQLDPEDYRELIRRYLETAGAQLKRFGGFVGQVQGDGMLVYFGYPKAHEHAAALGVRAALAVLHAIKQLNAGLSGGALPPLQVRIGMHTGMMVVGELTGGDHLQSSAVVGRAPNLAARLQTLAQPGTVVISSETHALLGGKFRCVSLGEVSLKGLAAAVSAFEVIEEREASSTVAEDEAATALIGRNEELARLDAAWARVQSGGGEFVVIRGEAGIGKSRLLAEFRRNAGKETPWLALQGSEQAHHSALQPLLAMLREQLAFVREDAPAEKIAKVERWAERLGFPVPETRALLSAALAIDGGDDATLSPAATRARLMAWLPDFLATCAHERSAILAIEDLHWLDASTLEALRLLGERGLPRRVLIVGTTRPEFHAPWLPEPPIELGRLDDADVAGFIESLSGKRELPPDIVRQVMRKSDGIPLFIEEMTRMALDTKQGTAGQPAAPLAIPETLHALLMARLDRTTTNREVAQLAAVLGSEFHFEMLRFLCPLQDSDLVAELGRLVEAGLLARHGTIPDATFAFRHALIHAEAYQSLLRRKRQQYHGQIARMLEELFPETLQNQPELVAQHYTEAGRAGEAVQYWQRAAQQAADRMASHEALAHAERGLALLPALPSGNARTQLEFAFTLVRGWALTLHRGFAAAEVAESYHHARILLDGLKEPSHALHAAPSLFGYYIATADFPTAREVAMEIIHAGEETNDDLLLGRGWFSLGTHDYYVGQLERADAAFATALTRLGSGAPTRSESTLDPRVGSLGWGALTQLMRGFPDTALDWVRRSCERAESLRHPHNIAFARQFEQLVHHWRGEPELLLVGMEEYLATCREQGFGFWLAIASLLQSWALGMIAPSDEALAGLRRGLALWDRTAARIASAQHYATVAEIAIKLERFDEAAEALDRGRADAQRVGERIYEPHLDILEGELWRTRDPARAEISLRSALALARQCGARWHELRAATALARVLQSLGRKAEAGAELAPVAGWFTEGGDLASVRDARALLADLICQ